MKNLPAIQMTEQLYYENILRYDTVHLKRYVFALSYMDENTTVLDFGGGAGYGSFVMSGECKEVFLVDADLTALTYAKDHYFRKNITYLNMNRPPSDWMFDTITCFECVEHVDEPLELMKRFYSLLNPNGVLIMSVPNEREVPHAQSTNHFHKQHFTADQLEKLITDAGFTIELKATQWKKMIPAIIPKYWGGFCNIAVCRK